MSKQDAEIDQQLKRLRGQCAPETIQTMLLQTLQDRRLDDLGKLIEVIRDERHDMTAGTLYTQLLTHALQVGWDEGYDVLSKRGSDPLITPTLLAELNEAERFDERDRLLDGRASGVAYEVGNLRGHDDRTAPGLLLKLYFEKYEQGLDQSLRPMDMEARGGFDAIRNVERFAPASERGQAARSCRTALRLLEPGNTYEQVGTAYRDTAAKWPGDEDRVFDILFSACERDRVILWAMKEYESENKTYLPGDDRGRTPAHEQRMRAARRGNGTALFYYAREETVQTKELTEALQPSTRHEDTDFPELYEEDLTRSTLSNERAKEIYDLSEWTVREPLIASAWNNGYDMDFVEQLISDAPGSSIPTRLDVRDDVSRRQVELLYDECGHRDNEPYRHLEGLADTDPAAFEDFIDDLIDRRHQGDSGQIEEAITRAANQRHEDLFEELLYRINLDAKAAFGSEALKPDVGQFSPTFGYLAFAAVLHARWTDWVEVFVDEGYDFNDLPDEALKVMIGDRDIERYYELARQYEHIDFDTYRGTLGSEPVSNVLIDDVDGREYDRAKRLIDLGAKRPLDNARFTKALYDDGRADLLDDFLNNKAKVGEDLLHEVLLNGTEGDLKRITKGANPGTEAVIRAINKVILDEDVSLERLQWLEHIGEEWGFTKIDWLREPEGDDTYDFTPFYVVAKQSDTPFHLVERHSDADESFTDKANVVDDFDEQVTLQALFDAGAPVNTEVVRRLIKKRSATLKPLLETCAKNGFEFDQYPDVTKKVVSVIDGDALEYCLNQGADANHEDGLLIKKLIQYALKRKRESEEVSDGVHCLEHFDDELIDCLEHLVEHGANPVAEAVQDGLTYAIEAVEDGFEFDNELLTFFDELLAVQTQHGTVTAPPMQKLASIKSTNLYDTITRHMRGRKVKQLEQSL